MTKRRAPIDPAPRMGVSEFKAKCLGIIDQLGERGGRLVLTKRGREVAELRATAPRKPKAMFGSLRGKIKIQGDIVYFDTGDLWEVLK